MTDFFPRPVLDLGTHLGVEVDVRFVVVEQHAVAGVVRTPDQHLAVAISVGIEDREVRSIKLGPKSTRVYRSEAG